MENISPDTIHNFCRSCLQELKQRQRCKIYSLDLKIRHWLEDPTINDPLANDEYPSSICYSCKNKLEEFLEFRKMCKRSRETIFKILPTTIDELEFKNTFDLIKYCGLEDFVETNYDKDFLMKHVINSSFNEDNLGNQSDNKDYSFFGILDYFLTEEEKKIIGECEKPNENLENLLQSEKSYTESESNNQSEDNSHNFGAKKKIKPIKKDHHYSKEKNKRKEDIYIFHCDQCKYRCRSQQNLDIHMRTHYGLKPYQCPRCKESFDKTSERLKHLNEIHKEKKISIIYEYDDSAKQSTSTRSYKDHYLQSHISQQKQKKHDNTVIEKKATNKENVGFFNVENYLLKDEKRIIIDEGGKYNQNLEKNLLQSEKSYTEAENDNQSKDNSENFEAVRKIKPKEKTDCNYSKANKRKEYTHSLHCDQCKYRCLSQQILDIHTSTHCSLKQYQCPKCKKSFDSSSQRLKHLNEIHKENKITITCEYKDCAKQFTSTHSYKDHCRQSHIPQQKQEKQDNTETEKQADNEENIDYSSMLDYLLNEEE